MAVANLLWITLLAISALTVLLAGATIGSAAYTLQQYKDQKAQNNPWWLPIWTDHFDLNGTKSLIASGSVSLALGLVYFLALAIPRFQVAGRPKLSLAIASATAIPSVVVSVFAIAFVQVLNQKSPDVDTIESWTCRWSQTPAIAKELSVPATFTNEGFGTLCTASRFAFGATVAILALQLALVSVAFMGTRERFAMVPPAEKGSPDQQSLEFARHSPVDEQ